MQRLTNSADLKRGCVSRVQINFWFQALGLWRSIAGQHSVGRCYANPAAGHLPKEICPAMRLHCFSLAAAAGCSEEEDDHPSCRFLRPNKVSLSPTNKTASMALIQQRRPIRRSSKAQTGPRKPLSLNLAPPSFSLESRHDAHLPPPQIILQGFKCNFYII